MREPPIAADTSPPPAPPERGAPAPPANDTPPLALVARHGNRLVLASVDARTQHLGLRIGTALADAQARFPRLVTLPQDPAADARALDALAAAMARFTPMVAPDPPDGLILDITGATHLFGAADTPSQEAALTRAAIAEAARILPGLAARPALASHAAAARALARHGHALARYGGDDVRALPIAALELPEASLTGLSRAGLTTLGDLARRPLSAIAARFGEAAVARLRAILGESDTPITPRQPPAPIHAEARFAEPVARTEHVLDVIETLLHDTARQMERRQLGGRRFSVVLERSDGAKRRLTVETGLPTRDPAPVMRLFAERIEHLADPLDPGFGFDAILLAVPRTEPSPARQTALETHHEPDGTEATIALAALLDRLATRLGPDHIRRLSPRDSHIPEAAQALIPAIASATASTKPTPWPPRHDTPLRPLLLFDPPQPIAAIAGVPDGPPQRIRWRGHLHEIRRAEGPERIAAEWWQSPLGHCPGHATPTRDYYRIEDAQGRRFWVFRHGLFDERESPQWYLHGLFA